MTQPANTEPQDFLAWLASQADGRTVAELSDGLAELVRRVNDTGCEVWHGTP